MSPPTSSALFRRSLDKTYPTIVGTEGIYLLTADGRKILDGSSGAAVSCLGHGNREVIGAICKQVQRLAFAHTSFFTSDPAEERGRLMIEKSYHDFNKVLFLTSSSEAAESALKLALQYHICNNQPQRVNVIGRKHSYHGNTLGALAAGYNPAKRATFEPVLGTRFHHVSQCFYQADGKGISERAYEDGLILEFQQKFLELGPETVVQSWLNPWWAQLSALCPRRRPICQGLSSYATGRGSSPSSTKSCAAWVAWGAITRGKVWVTFPPTCRQLARD